MLKKLLLSVVVVGSVVAMQDQGAAAAPQFTNSRPGTPNGRNVDYLSANFVAKNDADRAAVAAAQAARDAAQAQQNAAQQPAAPAAQQPAAPAEQPAQQPAAQAPVEQPKRGFFSRQYNGVKTWVSGQSRLKLAAYVAGAAAVVYGVKYAIDARDVQAADEAQDTAK